MDLEGVGENARADKVIDDKVRHPRAAHNDQRIRQWHEIEVVGLEERHQAVSGPGNRRSDVRHETRQTSQNCQQEEVPNAQDAQQQGIPGNSDDENDQLTAKKSVPNVRKLGAKFGDVFLEFRQGQLDHPCPHAVALRHDKVGDDEDENRPGDGRSHARGDRTKQGADLRQGGIDHSLELGGQVGCLVPGKIDLPWTDLYRFSGHIGNKRWEVTNDSLEVIDQVLNLVKYGNASPGEQRDDRGKDQ